MAHQGQIQFCEGIKNKLPYFFTNNKKILDVGSLDINGSNRYLFENCDYLGIDVGEGKNVDLICIGHEFEGPDNYYDAIITTNMLEHDMHYEKTIKNIIRMLKPGGLFLFSSASTNWPEHGTRKTSVSDAPLLMSYGEWGDYYKNLEESDFNAIEGFNSNFPDGTFIQNKYGQKNDGGVGEYFDLCFYGIKNGNDYLKYIL